MIALVFCLALAQQTTTNQDRKELFEWFEAFGVSQYLEKPLVSFGTDAYFESGVTSGFLIEESDQQITVLTPNLAVMRLPKKDGRNYGPIVPASASIRQTLANTVRYWEQGRRSDQPHDKPIIYTSSGVLAWLCHKFGMEKEALAVIESDKGFRQRTSPPRPASLTYLQNSKNEAVRPLFFAASKRLEQDDLSNSAVLQEFERIRPAFRGTTQAAEVDEAISILHRMIIEERIHVPRSGPLDEQIAEAIWQIPYQDRKYGNRQKVLVPASESNLRYSSVPQLIEALDDRRFLRGPWPRDWMGPPVQFSSVYWTPKVCDMAHSMLTQIFDRYFAALGWDGKSEKAKDEATRWYRALIDGGLRVAHLQSVRHGGYEAEKSFDAVVKDYPDAALAALVEGYRNTPTNETGLRGFFAQTMARLPGDDALGQVLKICDEAKPQWVRIGALVGLVRRDSASALPRMKREWLRYEKKFKFDYDHSSLVGPLYHAGPEGARILAKDLRKQAIFLRSEVLTRFRIRVSSNDWPEAPTNLSKEYLEVMENLFGSELEDLDECYYSIPNMEKPRMCDVAMHQLAALFPGVYSFSPLGSLEPHRKAAIATYRKRSSLKPKD